MSVCPLKDSISRLTDSRQDRRMGGGNTLSNQLFWTVEEGTVLLMCLARKGTGSLMMLIVISMQTCGRSSLPIKESRINRATQLGCRKPGSPAISKRIFAHFILTFIRVEAL